MEGLATQLIDTFLILFEQSEKLASNIANLDDHYGAFTLGLNDQLWRSGSAQPPQHLTTREQHRFWASSIYACIDHRHDGDGRDTWQMAGVLVVPPAIIETAISLNETKAHFATLLHRYRQLQSKVSLDRVFHPDKMSDYAAGSGEATRNVLRRIGHNRVHLRHATRQIVCLKEYPKFMSLSWVRQRRSIQKISLEKCLDKLYKLERDADSSHIKQQINCLNQLPFHERQQLRQVQTVAYPSIKTKVYWEDGTDSHLGYLSVPALVPAGTHEQLPPMTNIAPAPPPARARRRTDNTLPEEPICPSIRVYLAQKTPQTNRGM